MYTHTHIHLFVQSYILRKKYSNVKALFLLKFSGITAILGSKKYMVCFKAI